jgi:hypothetical protein
MSFSFHESTLTPYTHTPLSLFTRTLIHWQPLLVITMCESITSYVP